MEMNSLAQGYIPLGEMRPWWLRLIFLAVLGTPLLGGGELHHGLHVEHAFADLSTWTAYALMLWLFVLLCVGAARLFSWLGAGAFFGLGLLISGAVLSRLGVWDYLHLLLGSGVPTSDDSATQRQLDLIFRLLMIMTTFPFFMLGLQSFSAAGIFKSAVRKGTRRRAGVYVTLAVFLRLFQHVFEVFENLLMAWEEENPRVLLPRHRSEMTRTVFSRSKLLTWWMSSTYFWGQALLIHSLIFVPAAVREWQQFIDRR